MLTSLRVSASGSVAVSHVDSSSACSAPPNGAIGTPEMPFIIRHWSNTGRNDSIAGGGDVRKLSGDSGQNWSMITPCGMYMKPRRTGGFAGSAPAAQPRESRNGSARETPTPLRKVRRSTEVRRFMFFIL